MVRHIIVLSCDFPRLAMLYTANGNCISSIRRQTKPFKKNNTIESLPSFGVVNEDSLWLGNCLQANQRGSSGKDERQFPTLDDSSCFSKPAWITHLVTPASLIAKLHILHITLSVWQIFFLAIQLAAEINSQNSREILVSPCPFSQEWVSPPRHDDESLLWPSSAFPSTYIRMSNAYPLPTCPITRQISSFSCYLLFADRQTDFSWFHSWIEIELRIFSIDNAELETHENLNRL